jgi:hypothetical protein
MRRALLGVSFVAFVLAAVLFATTSVPVSAAEPKVTVTLVRWPYT